jgi:hypothetical protein
VRSLKLNNPTARAAAVAQIMSAPDGWVVSLREPTRTLDQNALLWPLLTDLARQVDWPVNGKVQKLKPEEWKDIMTASLKQEQRVASGVDGGFVILGRRTSTMGKREFSDLIEVIRAFGSERGVVWSA